MKKTALFVVFAIFIQSTLSSQPCLPDGIVFSAQAEIDNFQTNHPNCTEIEGYVIINGENITNLNGLSVLTSIGGYLMIGDRDTGNTNLINLTGLEGLTSIGGDLYIAGNLALISVTGLDNLAFINGSFFLGIPGMLGQFTGNPMLNNLTGLDNLTFIGGSINIRNNNVLTNLTGLEDLTSIGGNLWISGNDALTSLSGLDNINSGSIVNLIISGNSSLSTCEVQSVCNFLASPNGDIFINNNAPGCTSQAEVEEACGWVSCLPEGITFTNQTEIDNFQTNYPNCTEIDGDVTISGDDIGNLNGLSVLTSIGGYFQIGKYPYSGLNPSLTNLTRLDNVASIGGRLWVVGNELLTSLTGLGNVTSIGGNLSIYENAALTSLAGLDNLTYIETWLHIYDNPYLSSCEAQGLCDYLLNPNGHVSIHNNATGCNNPPEVANACGFTLPCLPYGKYYLFTQADIDNFATDYPNCTELEGDVIISGDGITNLNGLSVLTSIGEDLIIGNYLNNNGNPNLTSLAGLEGLTSIGGYLGIGRNNTLTNLSGIDNIDANSMDALYIYDNISLSMCEVQSVCDYLSVPGGTVEISGNTTGCNSQEEVEQACLALTVEEVNDNENYSIYPNPVKDIAAFSSEEITSIEIYDMMGKLILRRNSNKVDMSNLNPGIYFVIGFDKYFYPLYKGKVIKK